MKKIILAVLVIFGLAFSSQAMALPPAGGGLPYVIKDSCTSWTRNNIACITKATKVVCIGNGSSCVDIGVGSISDTAYDATSWDGVTDIAPSKNAVRDKFETLAPGGLLQGIPIIAAGGTADAITANYSPDITLADKTIVAFVALGANTITTPTFNADSLGAKTIVKQGGMALVVGDIPRALYVCLIEYNLANTRWELLNPAFPIVMSDSISTTSSTTAASSTAVKSAYDLANAALPKVKIIITKSAAYTLGTDSPNELYGGSVYVTGNFKITLPAGSSGMNACVFGVDATVKYVDATSPNFFFINGAVQAAGEQLNSVGLAGDTLCFEFGATNTWFVRPGLNVAWTNGG